MMSAFEIARRQTRPAEGLELKPYRDTEGYWTIGIGHKLPPDLPLADVQALRWTEAEAVAQFDRDLKAAHLQAQTFDWFDDLDPVRQAAVTEMIYNLGLRGFYGFKRVIWALKRHQWAKAAAEVLDSKVARTQAPARYRRIALMLRDGVEPAL